MRLDRNFFDFLKGNQDRYVRQKAFFFTEIVPIICDMLAHGQLSFLTEGFVINLSDDPMLEEDPFEFKASDLAPVAEENCTTQRKVVVSYKDNEYSMFIRVTKDGETITSQEVVSNLDSLIETISDRKFRFLQEAVSEFFENLNMKYVKESERAHKSNMRLAHMMGLFKDEFKNYTTLYTVDGQFNKDYATNSVNVADYYNCCKCNQ